MQTVTGAGSSSMQTVTGAGSSSMQTQEQGAAAGRHRSREQQYADAGAGSSSRQTQEQKLGLPEENGADVLKEI